ncbi:MAG: DUF4177 domain-containing protein [Pararhodobacter sp.]|nr:DUF4177 domain-containing protein [Pararhodobacter sp.]
MYEYKVIPAPVRTAKVKGLKTTAERFAHLLEGAVNAEAVEGWEFLRAETLPCEERKGLTGTAKTFQTVLVFRRAPDGGQSGRADPALSYEEPHADAPHDSAEPADDTEGPQAVSPRLSLVATRHDQGKRQEPVLRPGAALRAGQPERAEPVLRTRAAQQDDPDDASAR